MFHPNSFRTFTRVTKILFLLLLIAFECVPGLSGGDAYYLNEAGLQRTRSQILINAAYTLQYRPASEHAHAIQDLQMVLPAFEQEEMLLQTNTASDIQDLVQQAGLDYLPLIAATQIILAHPYKMIGPQEVNILALHEHSYLVTINALVLILPRHFEDRNIQLFVIQIVIEVVFLLVFFLAMGTFVWEMGRPKSENTTSKETRSLPISFVLRRLTVFVLVCVLIGLEIVPLGIGNETADLNQATLQRVRCEVITKSALVLAYRPTAEKTAALSDLQITLPLFQQEQATLQSNGDAKVHRQVQQAAGEYQTVSTAAQTLLAASGKTVDSVSVTTIVSHTAGCVAMMNGIIDALQNHMEQQTTLVFVVEVTIEGILILFFGALLLFSHDPFAPK